jgi:hypothetical protein
MRQAGGWSGTVARALSHSQLLYPRRQSNDLPLRIPKFAKRKLRYLNRISLTPNVVTSPCCFVIWWTPRRSLASSTPIYGWFTEGFDTADLQEAQALLKALRA